MTTHDEQTNITPTRQAATDTTSPEATDVERAPVQDEPVTSEAAPSQPAPEPTDSPADAANVEAEPSTDKPLFADGTLSGLRSRWDDVQAAFVDDPKQCVQKADALVGQVVEQLTTGFAEARERLEAQWARGESASTEDLRVALKRYREFFQRLLSA
jgi:hypothetical protein